jgi:hypothetical protein
MGAAKEVWQPWVKIKWKPGAPSTAWEAWKGNSSVRGAWSTQGQWDGLLWLNFSSWDELENFVWKNVRNNQWVEATETQWSKQWW